MKFSRLAAVMLLSAAAVPAVAQAQAPTKPKIAAGATVYGPQGGVVGKVEKVSGETVVLNTGTQSASLNASAFGASEKGLTITFTQAQLNQAIEAANQATADKLNAALVPGAALRSKDGVALGVIKSIGDDGSILVEREAGPFSLKRDLFGTDANGLIVRLTATEIEAALAKATATPDATASEATPEAAGAEATSEATPKAAPEATPKAAPEAAGTEPATAAAE